ncbi:cache domain-containing protein [Xinfangfangia sp. CPCC 101601]|uniref:histidine kinase n=1 Tax=Pseudogemmobacter lacusdianii TaxID=3069608 RepID=A0ABU0VZ80_9RHOB|nr:ATP-binding protein [Xinfangfangia sp. CPCC 101601]MDQ2067054.1 cache domain-containing protein [Xinfangfangia sp. CPCC 101601]
MKTSLGLLLAIGLAGLQFLAVLVVVSSSYVTSEQALIRHARDLLSDVGAGTIEHARSFLSPAEGAAELAARLAQNRVIASDDPDQLEQLLFQHLLIAPHFAGIYYGGENGDFVMVMRAPEGPGAFQTKVITHENGVRKVELIWRTTGFREVKRELDPDDPYDPRTRPWYQMARDQRNTIWTDPYIFFTSQHPGITLAAPVRESGQSTRNDRVVRGVIGVDIEISRISDFLAGLKIGTHGRAFILNSNGDVIAHPDKELLRIRKDDGSLRFSHLAELDDPIARAAFGGLLSDGQVHVAEETKTQFTYNGARYVGTVMPMGSKRLPWTIAVYAPEDDFTSVIKENRKDNILIAALVAVITGVSGLALAHYIHKPVRAFAIRSALISQGEVAPNAPMPRTYQELERANEALVQQIAARRQAEHEYGRTFELSSLGMAQLASHCGAFLRVNPRFTEITGYTAEELQGLTMADLGTGDVSVIWPVQADGRRDFAVNRDLRLLRKTGESIWVSVNGNLIRDGNGNALHVMLTIDDITATREKEARIEQLNRDLSHLARINTMGQMATGLAHELNQPLTAIAQNADTALLLSNLEDSDGTELRVVLQEIERQSLRAGQIIHALRTFIRKDEGARVGFDIGELIDQTLHLLQAELADTGVLIDRHLPVDLPQAWGNRVQLAQVMVNLLRNAIEALAAEEDSERRILLAATASSGEITIMVQDNGPGMPANLSPFTQYETTKRGGMGLGLSICKSMVETNGGRIWYESAPGRGSTFRFTVPCTPIDREGGKGEA